MEFQNPEVIGVEIETEFATSTGKQYCDTADWSGCCYNG